MLLSEYKEIYARRKETIERVFGTAKEQQGLRYTQYIGKARMEMRDGLTFACMNLKKLARILARKERGGTAIPGTSAYFKEDISQDKRDVLEFSSGTSLCLQSEISPLRGLSSRQLYYIFKTFKYRLYIF